MKEIKAKDIYIRVRKVLPLGVKMGNIFLKQEGAWKKLQEGELPIIVRRIFRDDEICNISTNDVKEAIERIRQDPELQLQFADENETKYVKVKNGVFNVETGRMQEAKELEFSYCLSFQYVSKEKRKTIIFDTFVETVFPTETEKKRKLLDQILGYCISDCIGAKTAFFLIGASNSGKSTLLELLKKILPENKTTAIPLYRLENRFNLARLADSKLNISAELSEKSFKELDIFKMLTSNDLVTAEHKGKKPFEFRLRCKSINAGNLLPDLAQVEGMKAVINRMTLLLFPVEISQKKQDKKLLEKLWGERDSIFSEALDSLYELMKNNFIFVEPEDSKNMKEQMLKKSNCFSDFIKECCVEDAESQIHFTTLYECFKEFCEENFLDVKMTKTQFSQKVVQLPGTRRGKFRVHGSKPLYGVIGLRLKEDKEYTLQDSQMYSEKKEWNDSSRNNGTAERILDR